jgi:hypothetical protein
MHAIKMLRRANLFRSVTIMSLLFRSIISPQCVMMKQTLEKNDNLQTGFFSTEKKIIQTTIYTVPLKENVLSFFYYTFTQVLRSKFLHTGELLGT